MTVSDVIELIRIYLAVRAKQRQRDALPDAAQLEAALAWSIASQREEPRA
jgi:hypothetical protein